MTSPWLMGTMGSFQFVSKNTCGNDWPSSWGRRMSSCCHLSSLLATRSCGRSRSRAPPGNTRPSPAWWSGAPVRTEAVGVFRDQTRKLGWFSSPDSVDIIDISIIYTPGQQWRKCTWRRWRQSSPEQWGRSPWAGPSSPPDPWRSSSAPSWSLECRYVDTDYQ